MQRVSKAARASILNKVVKAKAKVVNTYKRSQKIVKSGYRAVLKTKFEQIPWANRSPEPHLQAHHCGRQARGGSLVEEAAE